MKRYIFYVYLSLTVCLLLLAKSYHLKCTRCFLHRPLVCTPMSAATQQFLAKKVLRML